MASAPIAVEATVDGASWPGVALGWRGSRSWSRTAACPMPAGHSRRVRRPRVGAFTSHVVSAAAEYERRLIGQRTRDALAEKRAQGVRLGGPQLLPLDVVRRIVTKRTAGRSLPVIAAALAADQVPTARGGSRWYPSTIAAVLRSQAASAIYTEDPARARESASCHPLLLTRPGALAEMLAARDRLGWVAGRGSSVFLRLVFSAVRRAAPPTRPSRTVTS